MNPRTARVHLRAPAPYGGSLHTSDKAQMRNAISHGWVVTRVRLLPTDLGRLSALRLSDADRRVAVRLDSSYGVTADGVIVGLS